MSSRGNGSYPEDAHLFADDERMERENAQKRINAKKEYIAAIEHQRRGKRQQYIAEMEREKQELLAMKQEEEFPRLLLRRHAKGSSPSMQSSSVVFSQGILRNKEEYDLVQNSAAEQLAQMQAQMEGRR